MKTAKADITPIRQRTQYTCMGASLSMALGAQGVDADEDTVNKVMGCKPMQGASWEQAIGAAQHFGMRATLVSPCAMSQLKEWTDRGVAVMIAWNPEGRDWSHASCVFDVDSDGNIHVADPNIPDPNQTVRVISQDEFFKKWFEKWPNYLVRRPALAIEREITKDGRQIMAKTASLSDGKLLPQWPQRTQTETFDGWKTTTSGYQVSTLGGKRYLTLFDLREKLPGQPHDFYRVPGGKYLVEFQVGPPPDEWSLPQAHFVRVVDPDGGASRVARKFKELWAVGKPSKTSELEDIWFNAGEILSQYGRSLTFYDDRVEARSEAVKLLDERLGSQWSKIAAL